jgi:F-type H+-transporting ATPase subunit b
MSVLTAMLVLAQEHAQEEVNPILPAMNEIVWGALSFLVLYALMSKFAFPAVRKAMDGRSERIRQSLDEAERAKAEAQSVLEDYRSQLADARNESARIIEEARQAADKLRQDLKSQAEAEVAEIRQRAQDDIATQAERVKAGLRAEMAELSIELAEKVVERSLDRDTNMALIENFINQARQ